METIDFRALYCDERENTSGMPCCSTFFRMFAKALCETNDSLVNEHIANRFWLEELDSDPRFMTKLEIVELEIYTAINIFEPYHKHDKRKCRAFAIKLSQSTGATIQLAISSAMFVCAIIC